MEWEEEKMVGVQRLSWMHRETLDLLVIWVDQKVQSSLWESHQNKGILEEVAKQIAEREHR